MTVATPGQLPTATPRLGTQTCRQILSFGEHAIIGISPFNSYFSEPRIAKIIQWVQERFSDYDLYLPDKPNEYTLVALGYSPRRARRKAHRQANYMRNRIAGALKLTGHSRPNSKSKIIDHEVLRDNSRYNDLYDTTQKLFVSDQEFRSGVIRASSAAIRRKSELKHQGTPITKESICVSTGYLLAELPVMTSGNEILHRQFSAFCYHECPPFMKRLYETRRNEIVSDGHAFLTLPRFVDDTQARAAEENPFQGREEQ